MKLWERFWQYVGIALRNGKHRRQKENIEKHERPCTMDYGNNIEIWTGQINKPLPRELFLGNP